MTTKWTRHGLARGFGAAIVTTLMVFVGLAPAGANPDDLCPKGTTIDFRDGHCRATNSPQGLRASRYSRSSGEIMWERSAGAIGYEISRDGRSLGVHDVLSWYMTGLEDGRAYHFEIQAVYPNGGYSKGTAQVTLYSKNVYRFF